MSELIRRTRARVLFLKHIAANGPTTHVPFDGPTPSVDSILKLKRAGLITTRDVNPRTNKRGNRTHSIEFTVTEAGRAWLAEGEQP